MLDPKDFELRFTQNYIQRCELEINLLRIVIGCGLIGLGILYVVGSFMGLFLQHSENVEGMTPFLFSFGVGAVPLVIGWALLRTKRTSTA